jgi:hypothetical protein
MQGRFFLVVSTTYKLSNFFDFYQISSFYGANTKCTTPNGVQRNSGNNTRFRHQPPHRIHPHRADRAGVGGGEVK